MFSQFVRHLKLIEDHLAGAGIAYQYLDGATPAKARVERIAAFQASRGDVFLISLKAGGMGLNLTAVDYVVHMDLWWNLAAEDQASDRAHRIGQTRPVTIYRLVAKGTIEEQIVELHRHKRDLAERLLAVLRQLRAGYPRRPAGFPHSVVLCGVRDVRDYRIRSSAENAVVVRTQEIPKIPSGLRARTAVVCPRSNGVRTRLSVPASRRTIA